MAKRRLGIFKLLGIIVVAVIAIFFVFKAAITGSIVWVRTKKVPIFLVRYF